MYHATRAQMNRHRGGLSAMFISRAIKNLAMSPGLFSIKTATLLWIMPLFEQIHYISLTAAGIVKTSFEVKKNPIWYAATAWPADPQQPFNWSACLSHFLSTPQRVVCAHCSVILSEWLVLNAPSS